MRQVAPARTQTHARILLTRDAGTAGPRWSDARVAEAVEVSARTVARVRARFAARGVAAAPLWPRLELQDMPHMAPG